jgi:hypothetical protein
MPRNEIAAIIGLIVVLAAAVVGPPRLRGMPRSPQAVGNLVILFVVVFAIVWIALRLINY